MTGITLLSTIVKIVIVDAAEETCAVVNYQGELLIDWGMAMSTFTNQTNRADIEARYLRTPSRREWERVDYAKRVLRQG